MHGLFFILKKENNYLVLKIKLKKKIVKDNVFQLMLMSGRLSFCIP